MGHVGGGRWTNHDTGIVDQDVYLSPSFDDGLDDPFTPLLIPDILREKQAFSSRSLDHLLSGLGIDLFFGKVDDRDLHALLQPSISSCIRLDRSGKRRDSRRRPPSRT